MAPTVTAESSREDLTSAIHDLNHQAACTHPSPAYTDLHDEINQILDWLVGY